MRKNDKNVFIVIIFIIIFVLIWTLSHYDKSKKQSIAVKESIQQQKMDMQKQEALKEQEVKKDKVVPTINAKELYQKLNANFNKELIVVDVRDVNQFLKEHIKGSIHIGSFDARESSKTIVFVTESGNESQIIDLYRELSQTKTIYNLSGGLEEWKLSQQPLISNSIERTFENESKVHFVEPRDLNAQNPEGAQNEKIMIVDTRRQGNYEKGHIPNSINIPFMELEQRYKEIPFRKTIYVYGSDEEESFKAGVLLYDLNLITNVNTIRGGFKAWKEYGYPVSTDVPQDTTDEKVEQNAANSTETPSTEERQKDL